MKLQPNMIEKKRFYDMFFNIYAAFLSFFVDLFCHSYEKDFTQELVYKSENKSIRTFNFALE